MKLEGKVNITHEPKVVWDFLLDYKKSCKCISGLQTIDEIPPGNKFKAVVTGGMGAVKATFTIDAEFLDLIRPTSAKMLIYGKAPGNVVKGNCEMILNSNENHGTNLEWKADISITGTIGMLATRFIPSISKKLTDEFFECVKNEIDTEEKNREIINGSTL